MLYSKYKTSFTFHLFILFYVYNINKFICFALLLLNQISEIKALEDSSKRCEQNHNIFIRFEATKMKLKYYVFNVLFICHSYINLVNIH